MSFFSITKRKGESIGVAGNSF